VAQRFPIVCFFFAVFFVVLPPSLYFWLFAGCCLKGLSYVTCQVIKRGNLACLSVCWQRQWWRRWQPVNSFGNTINNGLAQTQISTTSMAAYFLLPSRDQIHHCHHPLTQQIHEEHYLYQQSHPMLPVKIHSSSY